MPIRRRRNNRLFDWRCLLLPEDTSNQEPQYGKPERFQEREGVLKPLLWIVISIVTALIIGQL